MPTDAERNVRVATVADEEKYVPKLWIANAARMAHYGPYECVWMIDNASNLPVEVSIIDTIKSVYQVCPIVVIDPQDMDTWTIAELSEEWLECPTE